MSRARITRSRTSPARLASSIVKGVKPPRWRPTSTPASRRVVVDRLEVKQYELAGPVVRYLHFASIPDGIQVVLIADARKLRLRTEGHRNRVGERSIEEPAFESAVRRIDLELPLAIETQPLIADELGSRVL